MAPMRWCRQALVITTIVILCSFFFYLTRPDDTKLFLTRLNQLSIGVEQRITSWNWKDTDEEVACHHLPSAPTQKDPIPNVVHYVLLGQEGSLATVSYRTFLSIKAALLLLDPHALKIHTYGLNTSGPWWDSLSHSERITIVEYDRYSIHGPHGRPVDDFLLQHQADFLRLAILRQEGGIYLDHDVFVLKPFTELLQSPRDIVMGHEGGNRYGLCNAVILARAQSEFL